MKKPLVPSLIETYGQVESFTFKLSKKCNILQVLTSSQSMKPRHTQTLAIISFIVILLGVILYMKYDHASTLATYTNQNYGVTFQYPTSYKLTETKQTEGQTGTIVTLTDKGFKTPANGEGPTAITVAMYDATASPKVKDPLLAWITTSPYSNFTLSRGTTPGTTTIANQDARLYTWDGLYQGTTLATMHKGNVILFSVTYDGQADLAKRNDFTDIISTVQFLHGTTTPSGSNAGK
jgi:hypothetical protein